MVRVKVPAGRLTSDQFERLAELARDFATGRAHVTTRQDIQLYEVPIARTPDLLRRLEEVGLTSREACGNSVRNVTACPFAGVCADELFDVTPYALAITRHFLRNPLSQSLPRKFKISVSGCRHDCAMAPIHDLGIVAASHGENGHAAYGFTLYAGGGLGALPRSADALEPFTPIQQLLPTSEAIVRVFNQHGERKNRQRARMKFLIERVGLAEFQRLVFAERAALLKDLSRFPPLPEPQPLEATSSPETLPPVGMAALRRWLATNARPQRQAGHWIVTVRLPLGDLNVHQMRELAELARWCSRGELITTQWQDLCLPWVESGQLERLYDQLAEIGLALPEAERIQDITACPGADTCQIGITSSRGLARALTELLERPDYRTEDLAGIRIKISGCPNSCGQHHIADIGLFGSAKSLNGRLVPHYQLLLGGGLADGAAHFGQPVVKLPAKRVLPAVERLLGHYREQRADHEPFRTFVERVGLSSLQEVLEPFTAVPSEEQADAAIDWGKTEPFSLGGMGQGECAG
ncbi:MAG: nitrite/sulfite reductase [Candidatus Omnitrophica bacterium]|nr:nitrite/sulfite reductase [Candidatus Omnitrophota bacterium]